MSTSVFDQLTASLSDEERQRILNQVIVSLDYHPLPLNSQDDIVTPKLSDQRVGLSFVERVKVFLQSFLGRDDPDDVLKNYLLRKLQKDVMRDYGSYIDFDTSRFMPDFCSSLNSLAEALVIFRNPLNDALVERRSEFYAVLGGEESPQLQKKLFDATSPEKVLAAHPDYDNSTLRLTIEASCSDILREIESESRANIRNYTRGLAHLERLVNFNFDKCFAYYSKDGSCASSYLVKPLTKLNSILFSFNNPPPIKLIETLFLFSYQSRSITGQEAIDKLTVEMKQAIDALQKIKEFNKFPLTVILKIITDNYFYTPNLLSGGEEWFNIYQKFWQRRVDKAYKYFIMMKKKEQLKAKILDNIKLKSLPVVAVYSAEQWPKGHSPTHENSLGLVDLFMNRFYPKFDKDFLSIIKAEGAFFKKDNKADFINTMESCDAILHSLNGFIKSINAGGDLHGRFNFNKASNSDVEKQRHEVVSIANRLALSIIQSTIENLRILSLLLEGLSKGITFDGHYDSIMNMIELNQRFFGFKERIDKSFIFVKNFWMQLVDMKDMEDRILRVEQASLEHATLDPSKD